MAWQAGVVRREVEVLDDAFAWLRQVRRQLAASPSVEIVRSCRSEAAGLVRWVRRDRADISGMMDGRFLFGGDE
jgi:hypothetical protein